MQILDADALGDVLGIGEVFYPDRASVLQSGGGVSATGQRIAGTLMTILALTDLPCQVVPMPLRDAESAGDLTNSQGRNRRTLRIAFLRHHAITEKHLLRIESGAHAGTYNVTNVFSDALGLQTICEVEKQ